MSIKNNIFAAIISTMWICCSIFFSANLAATTPFETANEAYAKKDYEKAIFNYESILETGEYSADLYFNLGNAYFKNGDLGKAILNFERAKKYAPGDADILHNLNHAQTSTVDEIEPLPPFFVTQFFGGIRDVFSLSGWAISSLLFLFIGMGILIGKLLQKIGGNPQTLKIISISSLVLAGLGVLFGFSKKNHELNFKEAIVIQNQIDFKSAPEDNSSNILTLHEGTKVEILDKIDNYHKVKLANGDEGWIHEEDLEII